MVGLDMIDTQGDGIKRKFQAHQLLLFLHEQG